VRVQDDLGVDEVPGGDSLVQSHTKSVGSRHVCRRLKSVTSVLRPIYTMQEIGPHSETHEGDGHEIQTFSA